MNFQWRRGEAKKVLYGWMWDYEATLWWTKAYLEALKWHRSMLLLVHFFILSLLHFSPLSKEEAVALFLSKRPLKWWIVQDLIIWHILTDIAMRTVLLISAHDLMVCAFARNFSIRAVNLGSSSGEKNNKWITYHWHSIYGNIQQYLSFVFWLLIDYLVIPVISHEQTTSIYHYIKLV